MDLLPSLSEFEKAVERTPDGEISSRERKKALDKIGKEIASLRSRLELIRVAGSFVEAWKTVQSAINAPCNPFGIDLERSSREESEAWRELGVADAVGHEEAFKPYPKKDGSFRKDLNAWRKEEAYLQYQKEQQLPGAVIQEP